MTDSRSGDDRLNVKPVFKSFQTVPESFPSSEEYRNHHDVHLIDQIGLEKLSDCCGASADPDILASRELASSPQRFRRIRMDEIERGTTVHLEWGPRVVSQDHYGCVKWRVASPPPAPFLVLPWTSGWGKLVPPHNLHADVLGPVTSKGVVHSYSRLLAAVEPHTLKRTGGQGPAQQSVSCVPEGGLQRLPLTYSESIE